MIKTLSLFHGVGGLTSTSKLLDIRAVSEYEENIFLTADYAYHQKTGERLNNLGDITKITPEDIDLLGDIDLLIATPPCQAYSVGGKRASREDPRGLLWQYAINIIEQIKPKVIIVENVKNILAIEEGEVLRWYLESLSSLGYSVDFDIINSASYGLTQERERFFMMGIRNDIWGEVNEKLTSNSTANQKRTTEELAKNKPHSTSSILDELEDYSREKEKLRRGLENAPQQETKKESLPGDLIEGNQEIQEPLLHNSKDSKALVAFSKSHRDHHIDLRCHLNTKVNTLTTGRGCNHQSTGNYLLKKGKFYEISPEQAERLMGWPISMTAQRFSSKDSFEVIENSDSLRYKMSGNGVCGGILDSYLDNLIKLDIL